MGRAGGVVHIADIDVETCELPSWQFDDLLGERTRLVSMTAACPFLGTRTEVAAIARKVHSLPAPATGVEPLMVVDASAAALDRAALPAEIVGGAGAFGADSFNEQVIQGLRAEEMTR